MKELIKAIIIVRREGNKKLNVVSNGYFHYWNPENDKGWLVYRDARKIIYRHKILNKLLVFLKII